MIDTLLHHCISENPSEVAIEQFSSDSIEPIEIRRIDVYEQAKGIRTGLQRIFEREYEAVVSSQPRAEFLTTSLGSIDSGGVIVPVHPDLSKERKSDFYSSEGTVFFLENPVTHGSFEDIGNSHKYVFEHARDDLFSLEKLIEQGSGGPSVLGEVPSMQGRACARFRTYDGGLAEVSFETLSQGIESAATLLRQIDRTGKIFSFLPCSHITHLTFGLAALSCGWKQVFAPGIDSIYAHLSRLEVDTLVTNSRNLMTLYWEMTKDDQEFISKQKHRRILAAIAKKNPVKRGEKKPLGSLKRIVCLGGHIPERFYDEFAMIGVRLMGAYSITRAGGIISCDWEGPPRKGSAGKPIAGSDLRLSQESEIEIRSEDRWLGTNDFGFIDSDGYLFISGNRLENLRLKGGQDLSPRRVETRLTNNPLIHQVCVLQNDDGELAAVVTLHEDWAIRYGEKETILYSSYKDLVRHPKIRSLVQETIDNYNAGAATDEQVRDFVILDSSFSIEGGELSTSLKLRRGLIRERFGSKFPGRQKTS